MYILPIGIGIGTGIGIYIGIDIPMYFITHWYCFNLLTSSIVLSLISCLKFNSPLDPLPLNLLRILSPYLIDIITGIIRVSLSSSIVPQSMKYAYIPQILKKHNLDSSKLSNYRPVSQLSSISKTTERIFSRQRIDYIISNSIVDCFQSAYFPNRSTETALNSVFNDSRLTYTIYE